MTRDVDDDGTCTLAAAVTVVASQAITNVGTADTAVAASTGLAARIRAYVGFGELITVCGAFAITHIAKVARGA